MYSYIVSCSIYTCRICDVSCNNMLLYISTDPYIVNQLVPYHWKLHIYFRVRGIKLILSINHFDVLKLRVYEFAFDQTICRGLRYVRIFLVDLYMTCHINSVLFVFISINTVDSF